MRRGERENINGWSEYLLGELKIIFIFEWGEDFVYF